MKKLRLPIFVWLFLAIGYATRLLLDVLLVLFSFACVIAIPILMFRLDWPHAFEFIIWVCGLTLFILLTYYAVVRFREHCASFEEYRENIVKNSNRQALSRILLQSDPSPLVRAKATAACADDRVLYQTVLFDPDMYVRVAAGCKIQDEELFCLAIVGSGADEDILKAATTRKLSKQSQRLLVGVALENETPRKRALAAECVKEGELSLQLLRESQDAAVRKIALQKISLSAEWADHQPYFLLLALRDPNFEVRLSATYRLSDLRYARVFVRLSGDDAARAVAAASMGKFELDLADQTLLFNAALGTREVELQRAAAKGIRDAGMLQTLLERLDDSDVRRIALTCIRKESLALERPEVFLTIALESCNESIRKMAADLVTDPAQVSRLLRESKDEKVREQAILRTQEQADLAWSARNDVSRYLRDLAMDRIVSLEEQLDIACASSDASFAQKYIVALLVKAIRDGGIPPEMEGRVRRAKCADDLLNTTVCPNCGGFVSQETEWVYYEDRYNGTPYSDWELNTLGYSCSGGCKLSDRDPSVPLDQVLQNHRKTA